MVGVVVLFAAGGPPDSAEGRHSGQIDLIFWNERTDVAVRVSLESSFARLIQWL